MSRLSETVRTTCRVYFGEHKVKAGRTQLVNNRCDSCPLRSPCLAWGAAPARTMDELAANAKTFNAAAERIVCGEASDEQKREGEKRLRRMAEREEI